MAALFANDTPASVTEGTLKPTAATIGCGLSVVVQPEYVPLPTKIAPPSPAPPPPPSPPLPPAARPF
jgi:hypothetical protein